MCLYAPLSKCNGFPVTVNWKVKSENPLSSICKFFLSSKLQNELYDRILLPLQWCCAALHPVPHLPAGNQIASLTTNDLERHIFWCHLVLSFLAFILMWLVALESPGRSCQIMNCKTLAEEKRTRDREEKKLGLIWKSLCTEKKFASIIRWCFSSRRGVEEPWKACR